MRILTIGTQAAGVGGVQYAHRLALRALADDTERHELALVTTADATSDLVAPAVPACVRTVGGGGHRIRAATYLLREWVRARWDLVIFSHLNPLAISRWARLLRRPPMLAWIYGIEAFHPLSGARRWGLQQCARILYCSAATRQTAERFNPWLADLPNAVCHLSLTPEESALSPPCEDASPEDTPFALSIGRMAAAERYKGFAELIAVWPQVRQSRPDLRLVLIGDGDDRPQLEAAARSQAGAIRFLGRVDDATRDRYLRHCRCFCLPSRGEGFGLVYLEAMRAGRPVLTGDSDSGMEVIEDRVTGRAVNPLDPAALLEGICDVSGPRAPEYGEAGARRFLERFGFAAFQQQFLSEVRRAAGKAE